MNKRTIKQLSLASMAMIALSTSAMADQKSSLSTLPLPTQGGKFIWQDVKIYADWRIQKNLLTGHHRLLDPHDYRHSWGTFAETAQALNAAKKKHNLSPRSDEMVMFVHGITPVVNPFEKLEPKIKKLGLDTVKISYPSTLGSIEEHAKSLGLLIKNLEGTNRIHFVTHSMGALVLRHLLAQKEAFRISQNIGSIVLIAPPNQGAALAQMLQNFAPYKRIYGQAGQDLSPENARQIPGLKHPFIIIAGGRNNAHGYNPLIKGDDDGTVAVSETHLQGSTARYLIPALHSQVGNTDQTVKIVSADIIKNMNR